MYGKHFESMYEGSMYGSGIHVFAVWGWIISHARQSRVEINPRMLANTLGGKVDDVQAALDFLERPDPNSRHKTCDGRRLVKEGEFQYFLPSWDDYQRVKNEADRREYNRVKQAEYRANRASKLVPGPYHEADAKIVPRKRRARNGKPLAGEILAQAAKNEEERDRVVTGALPEHFDPPSNQE